MGKIYKLIVFPKKCFLPKKLPKSQPFTEVFGETTEGKALILSTIKIQIVLDLPEKFLVYLPKRSENNTF